MSNDTELFELCKEVYKNFPEWNGIDKLIQKYDFKPVPEVISNTLDSIAFTSAVLERSNNKIEWQAPLYTSDYLLEKLPQGVEVKKLAGLDSTYRASKDGIFYEYIESSDTPLKALLKLTLELHKAGINLEEPSDE